MPEMSIETLKPLCALSMAALEAGRSATSVVVVAAAARSIGADVNRKAVECGIVRRRSCSGNEVEVTLPEAGIDPTRRDQGFVGTGLDQAPAVDHQYLVGVDD